MTWLLWNIRGIHQRKNTDHLKTLLRQNSPQILVILEPKAVHSELSQFAYDMGFPYYLHGGGENSHIWVLWKNDVEISPIRVPSQAIVVQVRMPQQ